MKDDTIGPVITWTTEAMLAHKDKLLKIPGMTLHPCQLVMVAMMLLFSHGRCPQDPRYDIASSPIRHGAAMMLLISHGSHDVAY
jgi:hypothetical protein